MKNKAKSKEFGNTLKNIFGRSYLLAFGIILIFTLACNFSGTKEEEVVKVEDKIDLNTKIGKSEFKQTSGYYMLLGKSDDNPQLHFFLADYELDPTDFSSLKNDMAFEPKQSKVGFSVILNKFEKFDELILDKVVDEYGTKGEKKSYVFPQIYSDKGAVRMDYGVEGSVSIDEIKDGIIRGKIDYTDKDDNSVKGTFTAKPIGEKIEKQLQKEKENKDKQETD